MKIVIKKRFKLYAYDIRLGYRGYFVADKLEDIYNMFDLYFEDFKLARFKYYLLLDNVNGMLLQVSYYQLSNRCIHYGLECST